MGTAFNSRDVCNWKVVARGGEVLKYPQAEGR